MIRTLLIASLATLAAAEAEPKADADPYLIYGGYPYTHGLTYGAGYHPYYTYPIVKKAEEAEVKEADSEEKKTVIPLHYPINYGYYGHPLTHYYGKREAEAEPAADAEAKADPWLAYSGYAGYPYVYGARPAYYSHPLVTKKVVTKAVDGEKKTVLPYVLPYGGLYNYGYGYHGYPVVKTVASHVIAKRDAEAEPAADAEAEADPWLAYGYHGYGLRPYGYRSYYGGYPFGYRYGGYGYPYYG